MILVVLLVLEKNVPGGRSLKTNAVVTDVTAILALAKDVTGTNSGKTENASTNVLSLVAISAILVQNTVTKTIKQM